MIVEKFNLIRGFLIDFGAKSNKAKDKMLVIEKLNNKKIITLQDNDKPKTRSLH